MWWDREILPGKDFAELIAAELAQAKAVVVIWSPASGKSGWVRDEAHEGLERGALVPVLAGVGKPPIGYRSVHAVDLTGWEGGEHPGLTDVELAVDALRTGVPVSDRPEIEPAKPRRWPRRLRWAALGTLAVGLSAAGVLTLPRRSSGATIPTGRRSRPRAGLASCSHFATARTARRWCPCRQGGSPWAPHGSTASRSPTSGRRSMW